MSITSPARSILKPARIIASPRIRTLPTTSPLGQRKMSDAPTFGYSERQPTTEEKELIDDFLKLCTCSSRSGGLRLLPRLRLVDQLKPVSSAYARYSPSATFHDPIGLAKGLEAVVSVLVQSALSVLTTATEGAIQQCARHCPTPPHTRGVADTP
jgi:hypothetical protein